MLSHNIKDNHKVKTKKLNKTKKPEKTYKVVRGWYHIFKRFKI